MTGRNFPWAWFISHILGIALGLTYSWIISPIQYVDAEPQALRDDFKDHFRAAIAAAYVSNPDLDRARARLKILNDPDPSQALTAQAQRMLAAGESRAAVQQVAMLAAALKGQITITPPTTSEPASISITPPTDQPAETANPTTETTGTSLPLESTSTSVPELSPTPRPSQTPTATLGAPFQLVGEDTFCDPELAEGLLQIIVTNASRKQIPGAEVIVTWNNGEEHIFTGLKPELGNGYADFVMSAETVYSVRMADGGTPASELSATVCMDKDETPFLGGLRLSFQRP